MSHYRVHRSESDPKSRGGSTDLLLMDFMVRIHVTINRTLNSTEEDFTHRFVFPPLPPPLRFSREHLLPSLRSSSSTAETFARRIWSRFFLLELIDWSIDYFILFEADGYFIGRNSRFRPRSRYYFLFFPSRRFDSVVFKKKRRREIDE